MRSLPLVLAVILLAIPGSSYAQDPHAGHASSASSASLQSPAITTAGAQMPPAAGPGSDLTTLMSRINEANGDAKVALMAELLGRLVAAHGAQSASGSGMCGGAGHSCPMCQQHGSMMKPQGAGGPQSR